MKRTNYSDVAVRYDENAHRHRIDPDPYLRSLVDGVERRPLLALDLACGTGNYLAVQSKAFEGVVKWWGLDLSEAMLALARPKLEGIELAQGSAESLPYPDAHFDYLANNFAFHHFENKPRALDEMRRVCRPGARLRVANIDPARMQSWWVYRFFPEAWLEDQKRFWSTELFAYELEQRGWDVRVNVFYEATSTPIASALGDAERRDTSQLAIASDEQFARGLARLREAHGRDPTQRIPTEIALLTVSAQLVGA